MAPAVMETPTPAAVQAENKKSVKALEELVAKLSVSKAQDEVNAVSLDIATLINGDIEEGDAPTK